MSQILIRTTPNIVRELKPGEVFVFGSNLAGIHGAGAAKQARDHFGAIMHQGVGLQGSSYAIPTKDEHLCTMKLAAISEHVNVFKEFARNNSPITFLLTPVGCGLAGLSPTQIAPLFADVPENVILPASFACVLDWPYMSSYHHGGFNGDIGQRMDRLMSLPHSDTDPLTPPFYLPLERLKYPCTMYGVRYEPLPAPAAETAPAP